jgi:two-component system, OmpR family, response regulator
MRASSAPSPDVLCRGPLVLAEKDASISINGRQTQLSATEFRALRYLVVNSDRLVSWAELADHLWDDRGDEARAMTIIAINRLQGKIGGSRLRRLPAVGVRLVCSEAGDD